MRSNTLFDFIVKIYLTLLATISRHRTTPLRFIKTGSNFQRIININYINNDYLRAQ